MIEGEEIHLSARKTVHLLIMIITYKEVLSKKKKKTPYVNTYYCNGHQLYHNNI